MTTNEFKAVTFNDGEPLDPNKLNALMQNISNIYQSASLANSTTADGTTLQTPVIFTFRHKFENVSAGKPQNHPFSFGDRFTQSEISSGKVFVTTGVKTSIKDKDVITATVGGVTTTPTLYVNFSGDGTRAAIYVDIIAICMRDII